MTGESASIPPSVRPVVVAVAGSELALAELEAPLDLDALLPGRGPWEVELGFGKGRHLLRSASSSPERRFLGIEMVSKYFRLVARRARRRELDNLAIVRGEALYLLATVLPRGFAEAVHVYFPDPWPKDRHHKRRLFDPATVDLVLGLLAPGATLVFATDFLDYGAVVREILESHPAVSVTVLDEPWSDGPRTNYEAKYMREGRPILRLEARLEAEPGVDLVHPAGRAGVLAASAGRGDSLSDPAP